MAIFERDLISVGVDITDKDQCLREMGTMLYQRGIVASYERFMSAIYGREEIMSTGIGRGIAIPHGRDLTVKELKVVCFQLKEDLEFDSIDHIPVRIVFMVAIPQDSGREYMQVLKGISEYVRIGDNRRRLMEAVEVEDFHLLVKEINDAIESSIIM